MKPRASLVLAVIGLMAPAFPVSASLFEFTGVAEADSGELLYEEHHRVEGSCEGKIFQPLEHRVTYTHQADGSNQAFASKQLDYSTSALRPAVTFQQPGFNESLEIRYPDAESARVVWRQPEGGVSRSDVDVSDMLVVDAGFDNLVRQNWHKLVRGESVNFRFLAPTRGTDYAFILEPAQNPAVQADYLVQIRPDNLVLKFLVDPIILGYNREGALTAYSGLTNVRENAGQNYTATIRYTVTRYPECKLTP